MNVNKIIGWVLMGYFSCFGQWEISSLHTRSVKANQPWGTISTTINQVDADISVKHGVVTTHLTVEWTPGMLQLHHYSFLNGQYVVNNDSQIFADSLESSSHFTLPPNYTITELYLWVGKEKVRGYIQDRSLAAEQYNNIVGRRKDPALLETWGNGSYNLRVFPLESNQPRKIELKIIHGLENDSLGFQSFLPFTYNKYSNYYGSQEKNLLGKINLSFQSHDSKKYAIDLRGIGKYEITNWKKFISKKNLDSLDRSWIEKKHLTCLDKCLEPWLAKDDKTEYFGVNAFINPEKLQLNFDKKSKYLFIVNVPNSQQIDLEKVKKVLLFMYQAYKSEVKQFNVGLVNSLGEIDLIFPRCVNSSKDRLKILVNALEKWEGSQPEDNLEIFKKLRVLPNLPNDLAVVLIDGQNEAQFDEPYPRYTNSVDYQAAYKVWREKYDQYQEKATEEINTIAYELVNKNWDLFVSISGPYGNNLSRIANQAGGFNLGRIDDYGYYGTSPNRISVTIKDITLTFPVLYGKNRFQSRGFENIVVEIEGAPVEDLVILKKPSYNNIYFIDEVILSSDSYLYPGYNHYNRPLNIRVAGKFSQSGWRILTIKGQYNGADFRKMKMVYLRNLSNSAPEGGKIWAYQKGLSLPYASKTELAHLGKEYHIVNRSTSILALEPGMELWKPDEDPGQENQNVNADVNNPVAGIANDGVAINETADALFISSDKRVEAGYYVIQNDLSNISMMEILELNSDLRLHNISGIKSPLSVIREEGYKFQIRGLENQGIMVVSVVDLKGKNIFVNSANYDGNMYEVIWNPEKNQKGSYVVFVKVGTRKFTYRLTIP